MRCADTLQPNRIFIVDDHPLIRRVLKQVLNLEPTLRVVGEAVSAEDVLHHLDGRQLNGQLPDLFLVDFSLPGMDGAELVRKLATKVPDVPCLVVSSHHEPLYVKLALDAGAHGYVIKGDPDMLVSAIERVLRGEIVVETSA